MGNKIPRDDKYAPHGIARARKTVFVDATRIARELLGNAIGANLFLLGFAWQRGLIPVGAEAIDQAIELNDVAVEFNRQAFLWGCRAALDIQAVENLAADEDEGRAAAEAGMADSGTADSGMADGDLDRIIDHRWRYLTAYQNRQYADRHRAMVARAALRPAIQAPTRSTR